MSYRDETANTSKRPEHRIRLVLPVLYTGRDEGRDRFTDSSGRDRDDKGRGTRQRAETCGTNPPPPKAS